MALILNGGNKYVWIRNQNDIHNVIHLLKMTQGNRFTNTGPYALHMRALSRKSVIQKTATVLVRNGTKYDGQFLQEPFMTRLWPIESTTYTAVLAMDVPSLPCASTGLLI